MITIAKQVYASWLNPQVSKEVLDITISAINDFKKNLMNSLKSYSFKFNVIREDNYFQISITDKNSESLTDISSTVEITAGEDTTEISGTIIEQNFTEDIENLNTKNYEQELKQAFQAIVDFIVEDINAIEDMGQEDDLSEQLV